MTTEQLVQALFVAIATALATSVINNVFEVRRLQGRWKQETKERIAHYRQRRLEERLNVVESHVCRFVELFGFYQSGLESASVGVEEVGKATVEALRGLGVARTNALAVGDMELLKRLREIYVIVEATFPDGRQYSDLTHDEWLEFLNELTGRASLVLERSEQLLREEEMKTVPDR